MNDQEFCSAAREIFEATEWPEDLMYRHNTFFLRVFRIGDATAARFARDYLREKLGEKDYFYYWQCAHKWGRDSPEIPGNEEQDGRPIVVSASYSEALIKIARVVFMGGEK